MTSFAQLKVLDDRFNPQNSARFLRFKSIIRLEIVQNQQFSYSLLYVMIGCVGSDNKVIL
jgi:hypothetical protein